MSYYATEAEALADIEEGRADYDDIIDGESYMDSYHEFLEVREKSIERDLEYYYRNKQARIGETIVCAENRCRNRFKKKTYQQAFCCTKHKNQFWNRQKLLTR